MSASKTAAHLSCNGLVSVDTGDGVFFFGAHSGDPIVYFPTLALALSVRRSTRQLGPAIEGTFQKISASRSLPELMFSVRGRMIARLGKNGGLRFTPFQFFFGQTRYPDELRD